MKKSAARKSAAKKSAPVKAKASRALKRVAGKETRTAKKAAVKQTSTPMKEGATASTSPDAKQLAHGLHALLHTMQNVQRHEESLCSMMHALERGRRPNAALLRDLRTVLDSLPVDDYRDDVQDLLHALA